MAGILSSSFHAGPSTSLSSKGSTRAFSKASCTAGSKCSARPSSTTKVRLRSFEDCVTRCTRSAPISAHTALSCCIKLRIPRPTRVIAAHGAITLTRHTEAKSPHNNCSVSALIKLLLGSKEIVTLVSELPIKSILKPWRLKAAKTSAKKPTCCHIPSDSMLTKVRPVRTETALTLALCAKSRAPIAVPEKCGRVVSLIHIGTENSRTGPKQRGCRTFAPVVAISCASSKSSFFNSRAFGTLRGLALNMPGTSVQISTASACNSAPK